MSLTTHDDDSVTPAEKRSHVRLEAAWELDALAELLPTVSIKDTPKCLRSGYKVRAISDRIKTLAEILMSGLSTARKKFDPAVVLVFFVHWRTDSGSVSNYIEHGHSKAPRLKHHLSCVPRKGLNPAFTRWVFLRLPVTRQLRNTDDW